MSKRSRRPPKVRPPGPESIETPWRLFIALPLPEPVRALIGDLIDQLASDNWPVRWIAPETAHLTLHFLGNTDPDRAELLRLALAEPVARHTVFNVQTSGLGVFPRIRQPRVLWLGLEGQVPELESLQRDIGTTLQRLEFPVESGRFRPHITLGRVRENPPIDFAAAVERRLTGIASSGILTPTGIPVDEVRLIRSFLGTGGAHHEPVAHYPLR